MKLDDLEDSEEKTENGINMTKKITAVIQSRLDIGIVKYFNQFLPLITYLIGQNTK